MTTADVAASSNGHLREFSLFDLSQQSHQLIHEQPLGPDNLNMLFCTLRGCRSCSMMQF